MIAIINACGANFASVEYALKRLGKNAILTADPIKIISASHVILPGVGTANQAMQQLKKLELIPVIQQLQQPVLGICLGMQILHRYSAEGEVECLGILPGDITSFPRNSELSIPHMGWNQLRIQQTTSALLKGIPDKSYMYFVHSYKAPVTENSIVTAHYGVTFAAMVQHKNFFGVQFHPERSGVLGAKILKNFVECADGFPPSRECHTCL